MSITTKTGDNKYKDTLLDNKKCKMAKNDSYFKHTGELDLLHGHISLFIHDLKNEEIKSILNDVVHIVIPKLYGSLSLSGPYKKQFVSQDKLKQLEEFIYSKEKELNLENTFYELGQTRLSAQADIIRTLCRKVERTFVELSIDKKLDEDYYSLNFAYFNRLSDFFYIVARIIEKRENKLKGRK